MQAPGTGWMQARIDALMSHAENGKIAASIFPVMAGFHPARATGNVERSNGSGTCERTDSWPFTGDFNA
jgi:hypothetical protein